MSVKFDKKFFLLAKKTLHDYHDYHDAPKQENLYSGLSSIKVEPLISNLLAFDLEWSLTKDESGECPIIAAGFCDVFGNKRAQLIDDYLAICNSKTDAEKMLLLYITKILSKFDWSIGFYTTGYWHFDPTKHQWEGRDSDLIQLDKRLKHYGLDSPVYISDFHGCKGMPFLSGNNRNHHHIDAFKIFSNPMIKGAVYDNLYNAEDLDTISRALLGERGGKFEGMTGPEFELSNDIIKKRLYVFKDAQLVLQCIARNNYEVLQVISALSQLTEIKFETLCRSRGVGKIWSEILDRSVNSKLSQMQSLPVANDSDEYLFDTLSNYLERNKETEPEMESNPGHIQGPRYIGGWIYDGFKAGHYKNVTVFDVSSLYPTMIVNYNLSFETVNCQCCVNNPQCKVPTDLFTDKPDSEIPHICRNYEGLLTTQVKQYMQERLEYKALAKNDPDPNKRRDYKNRSNVYKILINSVYGQMGARFAKYENVIAAELVTRYGRATIKECVRIAKEEMNWNVIYGDTDSLFINNISEITLASIQQFIEKCKARANVTIELDKVYRQLLMSGKKNYLGYIPESKDGDPRSDKIVIKGLSGKKTDRCLWVRTLFREMLDDIKNEINPIIKLKEAILLVETGELFVPEKASMFRFTQQLHRNPEDYKTNVVQKIIGLANNLQDGDVIQYYKANLSPTEKYTQDITKASAKEYVRQLKSTVGQVLKLLGYDVKKELDNKDNIQKNERNKRRKVVNSGIDDKDLISLKDKRLCNFVVRSASLESNE